MGIPGSSVAWSHFKLSIQGIAECASYLPSSLKCISPLLPRQAETKKVEWCMTGAMSLWKIIGVNCCRWFSHFMWGENFYRLQVLCGQPGCHCKTARTYFEDTAHCSTRHPVWCRGAQLWWGALSTVRKLHLLSHLATEGLSEDHIDSRTVNFCWVTVFHQYIAHWWKMDTVICEIWGFHCSEGADG